MHPPRLPASPTGRTATTAAPPASSTSRTRWRSPSSPRATCRFDDVTVAAALLHDTVEDTDLSLELIEAEFGARDRAHHRRRDQDRPRLRRAARSGGPRTSASSCCRWRRTSASSSSSSPTGSTTCGRSARCRSEKQLKIAAETQDLFARSPTASGSTRSRPSSKTSRLKYLEPEAYQAIARGLNAKRRQRERFVERFIEPVRGELREAGFEFDIYGRPKSIYVHLPQDAAAGEGARRDLRPLRHPRHARMREGKKGREDCWRVYSILTDLYPPIPERFRDFISVPKSNGYQSLHTTVLGPDGRPVEIQIRTDEMHEIAERGVAAHWKYKEARRRRRRRRGADAARDEPRGRRCTPGSATSWRTRRRDRAGEFVKEFQLNLYDEEIYVFTPERRPPHAPARRDARRLRLPDPHRGRLPLHRREGRTARWSRSRTSSPVRAIRSRSSPRRSRRPTRTGCSSWSRTRRGAASATGSTRSAARPSTHGRELLEKKLKRAKLEARRARHQPGSSAAQVPDPRSSSSTRSASGLYDPAEFVDFVARGAARAEAGRARDRRRPARGSRSREFTETPASEGRTALVIDGERAHRPRRRSTPPAATPSPATTCSASFPRPASINIHRTSCQQRAAPAAGPRRPDHPRRVEPAEGRAVRRGAPARRRGPGRDGLRHHDRDLQEPQDQHPHRITVESEDGVFEGTVVLFVSDLKHLRRLMQRLGRLDGMYGVYRFEE